MTITTNGQAPGHTPVPDIVGVIAILRATHPGLLVRQLEVTHPADDDGIWFFSHPGHPNTVQLESSSGTFPFLVESDGHDRRAQACSLAEAVSLVQLWLGLSAPG